MTEDSTKTRILMTAGPIFADRGFRDATVRDICDQAGVNLASVNYYFGDKAKLYVEAIKFARESKAAAEAGWSPVDNSADPASRLLAFVRNLLSKLGLDRESDWQTRLLVREFLEPGEATREIVTGHFRPQFSQLLEILNELSGKRLSRQTLSDCGMSVIGQCLFYRIAGPMMRVFMNHAGSAPDPDQLASHIASFTAAAVRSLEPGKEKSAHPKVEVT